MCTHHLWSLGWEPQLELYSKSTTSERLIWKKYISNFPKEKRKQKTKMSSTLCWNVLSLDGCKLITAFLLSRHIDFNLQFYMIWKVDGWGQWHGWNNNLSNINSIFVYVINVFFSNGKYILPFASFEHSIPNITTNMNAQILHRYVSFRSVHDKICIYALQRAGQDQSNPV